MKTTITSALAAITLTAGLFAGQAQAHTHPKGEFKVRSQSDCRRTVIIRSSAKQTQYYCPIF